MTESFGKVPASDIRAPEEVRVVRDHFIGLRNSDNGLSCAPSYLATRNA